MTDWEQNICYLCEKEGADSKDHVPPKGSLPPEFRGDGEDLMRVPAHEQCNGGLSIDDHYFQIQIALASSLYPGETQDALLERTTRGLERPQAQALVERINAEFLDDEVMVNGLYRPDLVSKKANWERMLHVVERTARGIYYYNTRRVLSLDWPVTARVSRPDKTRTLWETLRGDEIKAFARRSFQYYWRPQSQDDRCGFMLFLFHDTVFFNIILGDNDRCAGAAERAAP